MVVTLFCPIQEYLQNHKAILSPIFLDKRVILFEFVYKYLYTNYNCNFKHPYIRNGAEIDM